MGIDIDAFLNRSIERFRVQQIGYLTATQVPFIVLENGLVFYGLPVRKGEISARLVSGAATVLNDIDFRYFQNGRQYKQHSYYQYKPGDVVVELGAYLGFYSMYAAKQVGPTGKVIAVEMVPQNFAVMQKNLSSNYPETTIAINRGIHNRRGIQTAYLGRNQIAGFRKDVVARFSNSFSKVTVEMDTVDNILEEYAVTHVDLMIVQVNGNEIDALQGMQRSLHTIDNFAIAAPYDSQGVNHVAHISDHLNKNGFAVMSNSGWVFAARRQPALKATVL